jgi:hypothetical protein
MDPLGRPSPRIPTLVHQYVYQYRIGAEAFGDDCFSDHDLIAFVPHCGQSDQLCVLYRVSPLGIIITTRNQIEIM